MGSGFWDLGCRDVARKRLYCAAKSRCIKWQGQENALRFSADPPTFSSSAQESY